MSAAEYELAALMASEATRSAADAIAWRPLSPTRPVLDALTLTYSDLKSRAEDALEDAWERPPYPRIELKPPVRWDTVCSSDRTWSLHLHELEPVAAPLAAYGSGGAERFLEWSLALAIDWVRQHPAYDAQAPYAWYDLAIPMRAFRLAYLVEAGLHAGRLDRGELLALVASVRLHLHLLSSEEAFASHSNHGIYQAAGQLATALRLPELPEAPAAYTQARDRLKRLVTEHFDEDGVHREHSPGYHLMVLRSLLRLRTAGLLDDPALLDRLDRAEGAMAWLVAPIGVVPNVGDSDRLSKDTLSDLNVQHPALEFALSQGRRGAPPSETFHAFRGAGYVAARDQWAKREEFRRSSYLLQSCGFHSRVHKHADDLSFVWFAEGTNLLADAGKYGYGERHDPDSGSALEGFYYSDPVRMYVESTRAHNCLEIDGRSYPRRRVRPYGSALIHAERDEGSGIVATESQARHWNVRHTRYLFHLPGTWTLVVDYAVDYSTDGETVHDYAQRFQFGPDLELGESSAEQAQFTIPGTERCLAAVELTGARLTPPVRGQEHPLLGFVSPSAGRLLPNWTTAWERDQARDATFATLLALVPQNLSLSATGSINATARKGRVSWEIGPVRHELRWERSDAGLSFGYESA